MSFSQSLGDRIANKVNPFTERTYKDVLDSNTGQYKIIIMPKIRRVDSNTGKEIDLGVHGMLKNNIQYSIKAEWGATDLENGLMSMFPNSGLLGDLVNTVRSAGRLGGSSVANAGVFTKKFYTKSGYLEISPELRVMDWDDQNLPLQAALVLTTLTIPKVSGSAKLREIVESSNTLETVKDGALKTLEKLTNSNVDAVSDFGDRTSEGFDDFLESDAFLTSAPPAVEVKIGNWLNFSDMVLEDVNVTFSKEMTKVGPLYADFSLTLSTRESLVLGEDGINGVGIKANTDSGRIIIN